MSRQWMRWELATAVACLAMMFCWNYAKSQNHMPEGKAKPPHTEKGAVQELGGADRYLTFVSTDKPIYRAGEKVYVRGVVLNAANHKPLPDGQTASATIEIKGPKGDVVAGGNAPAQNSVWSFAWEVPEGQAGGEYTIHATYPWSGHAPAERKFDIRAYRAPRLKSQITFLRDGYGPGDTVNAPLEVLRAEGGIPEGAKVTVSARVDGMEVDGGTARVDGKGLCSVTFTLPYQIPRGEGTLALVIEDGGVVETASKTIPILLQTVDLQIFPEGGELIAGYKNRVYLQANQPNGKPADLAGKLMSKQVLQPEAITEFRTEHEGRGRFEFTPEAAREYFLAVLEPAGIKTVYALPKVKSRGALIRSDKDIYEKGQPVTVQVGCTDNVFRVTLAKREVELAAHKMDLNKGTELNSGALHPISFDLPPDVDGVLTVTVWDSKGLPLAERLVFRQPARTLNISITPEKKSYVPGDNAKLTIKATDADGKPVSTVIGLTVTDDSVLEMVEKRDQSPRLPVMVFLEQEVKDLADAHIYLDSKNPKAPLATDLLLGTQGWRRFALIDLAKFIEAHGDQARRVAALKIQARIEMDQAMPLDGAAQPRPGFAGGFGALVKGARMLPAGAAREVLLPPPPSPVAPAENLIEVKKDMAEPALEAANDRLQQAIGNEFKVAKKRMIVEEQEIAAPHSNLVVVREFAHQVRNDRKPTDRVDFADTLYWNAGVKTDPRNSEATISFGLNDSQVAPR